MAIERLVHVIDDDAAVRDSLAFLLDSAGVSVRAYESALSFLQALPLPPGGCIVTDVRMPQMTGLELVRRLKQQGVAVPVIVMTGHADVPLAVEAMKAGVFDFVEKPFDDEVLLKAIAAALDQSAERARDASHASEYAHLIATLSPREREVLDALVAGRANKVIASDLGISARTVEVYRANVMTKMQAGSLPELVRRVLLSGGR